MNKKLIFLSLLLLAQSALYAKQDDGTVKGRVVNKANGQSIEYATAVLLSLPDSIVKKSTLTDKSGNYIFTGISFGKYAVRAQFVGFSPKISEAFDCNGSINLQPIALESSASIQELTVSGKKPYIEKKADRTVLNIAESATASGENAFEVLKKAPNVNVDQNDNININGKQGVLITINDRPTQLSGNNLSNYLKSVQGSEIEKIEIINTPPARYDAEGNTGVINIKIKKMSRIGFNGNANAEVGYSDLWNKSGGLGLNFRKGKTNVYANAYTGRYPSENINSIYRIVTTPTNRWVMDQRNLDEWTYKSNGIRAGVDFDINTKNTIGVMINAGSNKNDELMTGLTKFVNNSALPDSSVISVNPTEASYKNINYNFNYQLTIDTIGTRLNVDFDYGKYNNDNYTRNTTKYRNSSGEMSREDEDYRSWSPADIEIKSGKADFVKPFSNKMKLEAGIKASDVETDNDLRYEKWQKSQATETLDWNFDTNRSNNFIYDEKIFAAYTSIQYEMKSTSIKGGLRIEHTNSKGTSYANSNERVDKRSYTDLFPSFFVQQKLNEKNSIGLSYNRRIDRPRYQDLNPFRIYMDEYTSMEGNPFLKPQYTNNVSVNYSWKNIFFTEVSYSHTNNVMASMIILDENSVVGKQTPVNLNSLSSISWTNNINIKPIKWYSNFTNVSIYYNEYNRETSEGVEKNGKTTANVYMNNTFILPKQFTIELTGQYQSRSVYGMFKMKSRKSIGLGIQKTFMKDKARIKLSISDLFNTQGSIFTANYDNLDMIAKNNWKSRKVSLSLNYRFGQSNNKSERQRNIGSKDESNRITTGK